MVPSAGASVGFVPAAVPARELAACLRRLEVRAGELPAGLRLVVPDAIIVAVAVVRAVLRAAIAGAGVVGAGVGLAEAGGVRVLVLERAAERAAVAVVACVAVAAVAVLAAVVAVPAVVALAVPLPLAAAGPPLAAVRVVAGPLGLEVNARQAGYLGLQNRSVRPLAALVCVCVNSNGSDR